MIRDAFDFVTLIYKGKSKNRCTLSEESIKAQDHEISLYFKDQNFMAELLVIFSISTAIGLRAYSCRTFEDFKISELCTI